MIQTMFERSKCPTDKKLANFTKYVRRQTLARFLVQNELFKRQMHVTGNIIECGVHHGGGLMAWAKLSSTLEPYNHRRKIVGFDTFEGFPSVQEIDRIRLDAKEGMFSENYDIFAEINECLEEYDENRFINQIPKVQLVRGDANKTIPNYLEANQHVLVSLLYLDFDLYEPTVTALKHFLPRIPKGGIIAFDEVNNENWAGETLAMMENLDIKFNKLECLEFEPNISFIQF